MSLFEKVYKIFRSRQMENLEQKEIDRYWSDGAENYSWIIDDELSSFRVKKVDKKKSRKIFLPAKTKILDAGCGPGFFYYYIKSGMYGNCWNRWSGKNAAGGQIKGCPTRTSSCIQKNGLSSTGFCRQYF